MWPRRAQLAVITVRRTAAERFGRMIFWPVLVGTAMLFCFLIFLYFEIFPSKDREVDIFQHHNWANLWKVSTGSMLIIALISLQEMALLVLLPTISWLSLVTYEAHMKDPVERLSILLLEEQRIQRKGATMVLPPPYLDCWTRTWQECRMFNGLCVDRLVAPWGRNSRKKPLGDRSWRRLVQRGWSIAAGRRLAHCWTGR